MQQFSWLYLQKIFSVVAGATLWQLCVLPHSFLLLDFIKPGDGLYYS